MPGKLQSYFDEKPLVFQILLVVTATIFLIISVMNAVRFVSSPTDENLFQTVPSRVYVQNEKQAATGELQAGDLILRIDDNRVNTFVDFQKRLADIPAEKLVNVQIFRPANQNKFDLHLTAADVLSAVQDSIPPSVYIISVEPGGASDRAGILPGDLVYRINGKSFNNSQQADAIMRLGSLDNTNEYEILRAGEKLTLHVKLARFGIPLAVLSALLCGLAYMIVGLFLGLYRPTYIAARTLGLTFVLFGYILLIIFGRRDITYDVFSGVRDLLMFGSVLLCIALWINSILYFPKIEEKLLQKRWLIRTRYLLAFFSFLLSAIFGNAGLLTGLIIFALYMFISGFKLKKIISAENRKMMVFIKRSSIFIGLTMILILVLNAFDNSLNSVAFISLPLVFFPVAYLYTIGRYRLMDMDIRVRRNIQYTIFSWLWGGFMLVALILLLDSLLNFNLNLPNIRISSRSIEVTEEALSAADRVILEKTVLMLLSIVITWVMWKLRQLGQRTIDSKYFRRRFDYRRAASELAEMMATRLNMVDLAQGITEKITQLLHLKRAGVLFFDKKSTCCCHNASGFDGNVWAEFCMKVDNTLIKVLNKYRGETHLLVDYLPAAVKAEFKAQNIRIIIPVRYKAKLVGALLIGEKMSEAPFDQEDLAFLSSAARQASVAIENAFLYEELTEQERLKHELNIARRIQMMSLPEESPQVPGLDISGKSIPALEVGGDYFDYLNGHEKQLTVIVGDVSGKGTSAALYMSRIQGILRSLHSFNLRPRELFLRANKLLSRDIEKKSFVTALGAMFDTGSNSMFFTRAGHIPVFHYCAKSGDVLLLAPRGIGIGLDDSRIFEETLEEQQIEYGHDDVFLFLTDGLTEAFAEDGSEFGEERIASLLKEISGDTALSIRDQLLGAVQKFAGSKLQHDDQTVVVVKAL